MEKFNFKPKVESGGALETSPEAEKGAKLEFKFEELSEKTKGMVSERWGIEKNPDLKSLVGKGAIDTLGSVFGVRLAWEAPKLVYNFFKKEEQKNRIHQSTSSLLYEAKFRSQRVEDRKEFVEKYKLSPEEEKRNFETYFGGLEVGRPIFQKIKELNENLKKVELPAKEKAALRKEMADVLKEHRHYKKENQESAGNKMYKLLDLYVNNSAQTAVVAREAINTASIVTMAPWLRLIGYSTFAGVERAVKVADVYSKEHFKEGGNKKEKLSVIAKSLTVDAARETYNGLIGNFFNKEKSRVQKGAEFTTSVFKLMRFAGLAEFAAAFHSGSMTMQEGAEKFWGELGKGHLGDALKQGGENWAMNAKRLLSYIGFSENPEEAMRKLVAEKKAEQSAEAAMIFAAQEKSAAIELEELRKLGTIGKGEGITHAILRQVEHDPMAYGFQGDINDKVELHRWAQKEAYDLVVKNNYVNLETGEEVRVNFDEKNPSVYLLNKDGKIEVENPNEYSWNPAEEVKAELELARLKEAEAAAELKGIHEMHVSIKHIYKLWPFGGRDEEWEVSKNLKVGDVMAGEFGAPVGGQLDATEKLNRKELQEYIKELQEKTELPFRKDEGVEDYLIRANKAEAFKLEDSMVAQPEAETEEVKEAVKQATSEDIPQESIRRSELPQFVTGEEQVGSHAENFMLDKNIKGSFGYNERGQIVSCKFNWPRYSYAEGYKILKSDFFEILEKKSKSTLDLASAQTVVALEATRLAYLKKVLDSFVKSDEVGERGAEISFLKTAIADRISKLEEQYGKVFRK